MPLENWIQHSRVDQFLYDWQTVIAGVLAFAAGVGTVVAAIWAIWATRSIAREQIDASHDEAERVIAATREQTETTVHLERSRVAGEARAFHTMLKAAMTRVLDEADGARKTYPPRTFTQTTDVSVEAFAVRQCITKGAFAELRAACVRQGGSLTGDFLDLEREIDSFALQVGTYAFSGAAAMPVQKGMHAGLGEQLARIETKATALREKAVHMVAITEAILEALSVNPLGR